MSGNHKLYAIITGLVCVFMVALITMAFRSCDLQMQERSRVLQKCIDDGKSPIECRESTYRL